MKLWIELLVILCLFFKAGVVCIPLQQFLPFGSAAGDERATFYFTPNATGTDYNDDTSRLIALSPSYTIIGRQRTSLHVG